MSPRAALRRFQLKSLRFMTSLTEDKVPNLVSFLFSRASHRTPPLGPTFFVASVLVLRYTGPSDLHHVAVDIRVRRFPD